MLIKNRHTDCRKLLKFSLSQLMQVKERQDPEKASFPGNKMLLPLVWSLKELLEKLKASFIFTYSS